MADRTTKQQSFMFVNKDASSTSLSKGSSQEKHRIQSHVQSRRRRQAKTAKLRTPSEPVAAKVSHSELIKKELQALSISDDFTTSGYWEMPPSSVNKLAASVPLELKIPIRSNSIDPFNSSVVALDENTYHLLQVPYSEFIVQMFLSESLCPSNQLQSRKNFRHAAPISRRLNHCVNDKLSMTATLAYASTCIKWMTDTQIGNHQPEYYISLAIAALLQRLKSSEEVDDWLILAVYSLGMSEYWLGYADTAILHMRSLAQLVAKRGGMRKLSPYVVESLLLGNKYLALTAFIPFPLPFDWDPGNLPHAEMSQIKAHVLPDLPHLADGLLSYSNILDPAINSIVNDMADFYRVGHHFCGHGKRNLELEQWLFLRNQTLNHQLLALSNGSLLDECVRVALLIWLQQLLVTAGRTRPAKLLLPRIIGDLNRLYHLTPPDDSLNSLLFWIMTTAAMGSLDTPQAHYFIVGTARYAKALKLTTSEQSYRTVLEYYLYSRQMQDRRLRLLLPAVLALPDDP